MARLVFALLAGLLIFMAGEQFAAAVRSDNCGNPTHSQPMRKMT